MGLAGAGYGAARALEQILGEQMVRAQLAQRQQEAAARFQLDARRQMMDQQRLLMEHDRSNQLRAQAQTQQREGLAGGLVGALDDQFDPTSTDLDPEISDDVMEQLRGTTQAPRVRDISTLSARPVDPSMAATMSQEPGVGVRRLTPTGEQTQARRQVDLRRRVSGELAEATNETDRRGAAARAFGEGVNVPQSLMGPTLQEQAQTHRTERREDLETQEQIRSRYRRRETEAGDLPEPMTPDAVEMGAWHYLQTAQLPTLGMGSRAANARIQMLNRAGALAADGMNPAMNQALYKADTANLRQLQSTRAAINAYKGTAKKNIQVLMGAAENVPDLGAPILNRPVREVLRMSGSPEMAAYQTALGAIQPEIARILFNPNLTGLLTDDARRDAQDLIRGDYTVAQLREAIKVVEIDMNQREQELTKQIAVITERMRRRGPEGPSMPPENAEGAAAAAAQALIEKARAARTP